MPLNTAPGVPSDVAGSPGGELSSAINAEKAANPQMVDVQHPTKFGMLMKVMAPVMQGALVGGFMGRSHPGGGFGANNDFLIQQHMRQLQMGQFAANMAKLQSEIAKNQAEASYNTRRGAITRTGPSITVKDTDPNSPTFGKNVVKTQGVQTGEYDQTAGEAPDKPKNYKEVPTNQGLVTYDQNNPQAGAIPLTLAQQADPSAPRPSASAPAYSGPTPGNESGGVVMTGGQTNPMYRPRLPGGVPRTAPGVVNTSPTASPNAISAGVPLMPPGKNERPDSPDSQDFDYLTKSKEQGGMGLTPDQAHARMKSQDRKSASDDSDMSPKEYRRRLQVLSGGLNNDFKAIETNRVKQLAALDKDQTLTPEEKTTKQQAIEDETNDAKQTAHQRAVDNASAQGINLGTVPDYRAQGKGGGSAAPATQQPAKNGGATGGQKTASMDIVNAWAKKQGITPQAALNQFRAKGYKVQ